MIAMGAHYCLSRGAATQPAPTSVTASSPNQRRGTIRRVRALIATVAAVLLLVAVASGTSPRPVIAYTQFRAIADIRLYVTGPGGTREVGKGQDPSVAPDGRMVSSSALGSIGPALTLYETAASRSHSFFNDRVIATPLAWSPDSRYLAVLLQTDGTQSISTGLAVIDTTTMTARTVATGIISRASFAPSGPDRLVYGQARSQQIEDAVNLYTVNPDGSDPTQLTTDGNSLLPLWTARGIVYDRETRRGVGAAPAYQLWLLHGGHRTQLTHMTPRALVAVLVPLAASANGNRLIAEYEGPGVIIPLAVQLSPRRVRALATGGTKLQGAGISRDGRTLLLVRASALLFREGVVETVPFGGGRPTRIASGDSAAWNG
jgi:hypothetical protein